MKDDHEANTCRGVACQRSSLRWLTPFSVLKYHEKDHAVDAIFDTTGCPVGGDEWRTHGGVLVGASPCVPPLASFAFGAAPPSKPGLGWPTGWVCHVAIVIQPFQFTPNSEEKIYV